MSEVYRVCIYGAGGVGGYLAARLSEKGVDVTVIARGEHLSAIRETGLLLTSVAGDYKASVKATDTTSEVGIVDLIIVCCKSWQGFGESAFTENSQRKLPRGISEILNVADVATTLPPMVGDNTIVVPTQNGVEAPERLARVVGKERVLGGYMRIMALIQAPGHVVHNGVSSAELGVGIMPGVETSETLKHQLERMRGVFCGATGLILVVEDDIWMRMWWKLVYIGSARCSS
eukprot:1188656-Prorocentrum_minimum.AAC.3